MSTSAEVSSGRDQGVRTRREFIGTSSPSAEQAHLLARLAADSAARRGELAVLRRSDLDGRVLTIERGLSSGVLGSTKTGRSRRLTLGATTAALVESHFDSWADRGPEPVNDWMFTPTPTRETYMSADSLSHKFRALGRAAGVESPALHRLRHGVATHLVGGGKVLKAQARLGHRDPATTLRHYAHAVQLDDIDIADELDALLNAGRSPSSGACVALLAYGTPDEFSVD